MSMLTVTAVGGTMFHVSDGGAFLGSFDFGSLDEDGQYQETDGEIMAEAREAFGFDAGYPTEVK